MLRRNIEVLVAKLAELKPELKDLALTTNGFDIPKKSELMKDAGLDRMTISLDTLQTRRFREITGSDSLEEVYEAIEAAKTHGFEPVKINAVIVRGVNDDELIDFARFARANEIEMRFIEYMPLDSGHDWTREKVVSGREMYQTINAVYPLQLTSKERGSETSWKYEFADGAPGGIGIIAPVTEMFCGQCSRIRLTADGQIRTCLFSTVEHDLRDYLRSGASRAELIEFIQAVTLKKEPSHRINEPDFIPASRTMSFIGG